MEISDILKLEEGTHIEFKEEMNDSAYKTLAAFVNTEGGTLFIGISDDKKVKGVKYSEDYIRDLVDRIVNGIGIHPKIQFIDTYDKKILKIRVESGVLVSYRGRYYRRVGNTTREMHGKDLRNFFLKTTKWDALTDDYSLDEIDEKTVKRFIQLALRSGRLKSADIDDDLEVTLERLNLINKGKLTNASIILFGINPQKHFINAIVRVGKFKDDITIIGDRLVDGNLFQQVNEAEEAIKNLIAVKYEINGNSFIRKNIWDYPLEAIREALLNSIIHRDYHRHDVQTQIKIYNDHISFFNVGGLPEGMTVKKLITEHSSVARNPLIARVFYLSGLIEEYGSGIQRMMRSLNDAGLGEVRFQDETISFKLYFFRQLTHEKLMELGLNERQIVAMDYLKIHGSISTSEYSKIIQGVAKMTLRRDMVDLIDKKLIKAVGDKKGRYYELL